MPIKFVSAEQILCELAKKYNPMTFPKDHNIPRNTFVLFYYAYYGLTDPKLDKFQLEQVEKYTKWLETNQ